MLKIVKKFRGFSISDNVWVYGSLNDYTNGGRMVTNKEGSKSWYVKPNTVGQFVGKCDDYHFELFEYDIIERKIDNGGTEPANYSIEIICFRDAAFVSIPQEKYDSNNPTDWCNLENYLFHTIKKIGNIFDNPELIPNVEKSYLK